MNSTTIDTLCSAVKLHIGTANARGFPKLATK
jgi:hypothetical protein